MPLPYALGLYFYKLTFLTLFCGHSLSKRFTHFTLHFVSGLSRPIDLRGANRKASMHDKISRTLDIINSNCRVISMYSFIRKCPRKSVCSWKRSGRQLSKTNIYMRTSLLGAASHLLWGFITQEKKPQQGATNGQFELLYA